MVVNAILVAMVAHANHPSDDVIYHVGSSVRRPLRYGNLQEYGFRYFTAKPCINKDGRPVKVGKVTVLSNMDSFRRYMFIRYLLVLKVKGLFCSDHQYSSPIFRHTQIVKFHCKYLHFFFGI